jgi:hypothetical protein
MTEDFSEQMVFTDGIRAENQKKESGDITLDSKSSTRIRKTRRGRRVVCNHLRLEVVTRIPTCNVV